MDPISLCGLLACVGMPLAVLVIGGGGFWWWTTSSAAQRRDDALSSGMYADGASGGKGRR